MLEESISKRITSLRYLLIVFVVFIHANLTPDAALNQYHYDFIQPHWIEAVKNVICGTLGGAAVPLFFFFAAFLQFSKNDPYPVLLKKKAKTLLAPYVLWTCCAILFYFIAQSIPQTASYFRSPINIVKNWKAIDYLKSFTYHELTYPFVVPFWFLRDLMILIILSPVLRFLCRKVPALILILVSAAFIKNLPVFLTSSRALFFYLAGYYCAAYKIPFFSIADAIKMHEYVLLLAAEVAVDSLFAEKYDFGVLKMIIACLFFLKLSAFLVKKEALYKKLCYLSGFSFFLYAAHMPVLGAAINKITAKAIPLHGILCLVQFLLAAILTVVIGTISGIALKKICPPAFRLLSGGR